MYLKALNIQGFKSFPDKIEIKFGAGITAIVGPNGSGKSNISDAVRWVLGEQSTRTLRGAKMEDVIFGGTANRGAVGFAEVSLIIDNKSGILKSEYSEIMITRRYFRSGESEYHINKKSCRLKDIHELFMDTGLGRDGYSMIGQGKIDEILSLKSEDRREVFEEAAGITKFRYRKEEAEKKLAAAEENLLRISDILVSVEERIEPLRLQSEKAKKYIVLADELKQLEVQNWISRIEDIKGKIKLFDENIAILTNDIAEHEKKRDNFETNQENLTFQIQDEDVLREKLQNSLNELHNLQIDIKSRQAVLQENIKNNENNYLNLEKDIEKGHERAQDIYSKIDEITEQIRVIDEEILAKIKIKEKISKEKLTLTEIQRADNFNLNEKIGNKHHFEEKLRIIEEKKITLIANKSNSEDREDALNSKILEISDVLALRKDEICRIEDKIKDILQQKTEKANSIKGLELKLSNKKQKEQELYDLKNKFVIKFNDIENRIKMLSDMEKHFEGYPKTIKLLMKQVQNKAILGIIGPVSTIIDAEKEYVVAVETALSAAASHIVTETEANAKTAIEYLKNTNGGRATFLSLDIIKPSNFTYENKVRTFPGFVDICSNLVKTKDRYKSIISNILGRTVVAESLNDALKMAKTFSYMFRIVTLDGQVVNAGGSLTGGSNLRSVGSLSRNNERKELEKERDFIESEKSLISEQYEKLSKETNILNHEYTILTDERNLIGNTLATLFAKKEQFIKMTENIETQAFDFQNEMQALKNDIEESSNKISEFNISSEELKQKISALIEQIENETKDKKDILENIEKLHTNILLVSSEIDNLNTQKGQMNANIDSFEQILGQMSEEINLKKLELEHVKNEKVTMTSNLSDTYDMNLKYDEKLAEISKSIEISREKRLKLEENRTKEIKQIHEISEIIINLERRKNEMVSKKNDGETHEKMFFDKLWEKYELTPTLAYEQFGEISLPENSDIRIEVLRKSIRELGTVNVSAIEEYTELLENYNFLTEQKSDIDRAKDDLMDTIAKLTENMKKIFVEQFKVLNVHFGKTFTDMFGGGFAELVLENDDVLNCGIEIKVCPPGKALKTITLLSGGEKAFVAIALYFAILYVRPAPFCFLDEIEAALDDVNVVRFAKYVRKMAQNTQFIIITHRRGTMEESDILYGITMQQQGISKLLMLNVNEVENELNIKI